MRRRDRGCQACGWVEVEEWKRVAGAGRAGKLG